MHIIKQTPKLFALLMIVIIGLSLSPGIVKALTNIDTFDADAQVSNVDSTACSSVTGTDMVGGGRDILVSRTAGGGTVVGDVNTSVANSFSLSIGASTQGTALIQWDGIDGSCALNPTGLGGISLNPDDGLAVYVREVDLNGALTMRVYTNGTSFSTFSYVIPTSIAAPGQTLYFPFELFTPSGGGANFANVGAIELLVDGTLVSSLDVTIDFVNSDLTRDFGDLPAGYGITNFSENGARHTLGDVYLGAAVDADPDGQTDPLANGDTNDNGIGRIMSDNWGDGSAQITANINAPIYACLIGWIDWNGNNTFDTTGTVGGLSERVVNMPIGSGPNTINLTTPTLAQYSGTYPSTLNTRFRVFEHHSTIFTDLGIPTDFNGCPTPASVAQTAPLLTNLARNGEVEDYQWGFGPTAITLTNLTARSSTNVAVASIAALLVLSGAYLLIRRSRKHAFGTGRDE